MTSAVCISRTLLLSPVRSYRLPYVPIVSRTFLLSPVLPVVFRTFLLSVVLPVVCRTVRLVISCIDWFALTPSPNNAPSELDEGNLNWMKGTRERVTLRLHDPSVGVIWKKIAIDGSRYTGLGGGSRCTG
ncbi:hypothetical protein BD626DRAFT_532279 [Schizophyllum amplum]|uniref:Uncharacterized protein n=1 Tax=Schizophyllum amplum TaxID=97359 RepID=A0A550BRK3_9AGAR|nr:hypothetical protein BD626DRAFT_532279 [Auriculariopsis ampla]